MAKKQHKNEPEHQAAKKASHLQTSRRRIVALTALIVSVGGLVAAILQFGDEIVRAWNKYVRPVSIVDYNVDCYRPELDCALDIWLTHKRATEDLVLSTAQFTLVDLEETIVSGSWLAPQVYDCNISSLRAPRDTSTCSISHLIPRDEAGKPNYLQILLAFPELPEATFRRMTLKTRLETNFGKAQEIQFTVQFPWDRSISPGKPSHKEVT